MRLESDHGGIEIEKFKCWDNSEHVLESDHGGIEMKRSCRCKPSDFLLESDHGGIEMKDLSTIRRTTRIVRIRSWWD